MNQELFVKIIEAIHSLEATHEEAKMWMYEKLYNDTAVIGVLEEKEFAELQAAVTRSINKSVEG